MSATKYYPTGIAELDAALGGAGLKGGQLVLVLGPAASGRSLLSMRIAASISQSDPVTAWLLDMGESDNDKYAARKKYGLRDKDVRFGRYRDPVGIIDEIKEHAERGVSAFVIDNANLINKNDPALLDFARGISINPDEQSHAIGFYGALSMLSHELGCLIVATIQTAREWPKEADGGMMTVAMCDICINVENGIAHLSKNRQAGKYIKLPLDGVQ